MDVKNVHIQGNITISSNVNSDENGVGILYTDFINETTQNSGITCLTDMNINSHSLNFVNDLSEKATIMLKSSTDTEPRKLNIVNGSGDVSIKSKANKGITVSEIAGNVIIDSTVDAINSSTASLVVTGGLSVNKSMLLQKEITALDGIHSFNNTNPIENVLNIKNTSSSGYSSIFFKDSLNSTKLNIGYGNGAVNSPLNDIAYIQSQNGSELLFRGDNTDSFKILTNGSIDFYSNVASTSSNVGSMRLIGGLSITNSTDSISSTNGGSFTTGGGAAISKKLFVGSSIKTSSYLDITKNNIIPIPVNGDIRLYVDTSDNLIKSKDGYGNVTVYQPTALKGDIITHNGITQTTIKVGSNGYVLSSDSSTSTGLKWVQQNSSGSSSTPAIKEVNIVIQPLRVNLNSNIQCSVIEQSIGSYMNLIYPFVDDGSSCNIFNSKSNATLSGVSTRLNSSPSLINSGNIISTHPPYKSSRLSKNYTEGNGDYSVYTNEKFTITNITLTQENWQDVNTLQYGCFCISVSSLDQGPCATFFIAKSYASANCGNYSRINSSPGTLDCNLELRWNSNSYLQIRKTNQYNDGSYNMVDNFQNPSLAQSMTLSGTSVSQILNFNYYQNKSFIAKIETGVENYPCGIFTVSKNNYGVDSNIVSLNSPGKTSGEIINIKWMARDLLKINKTNSGYDGNYNIYLFYGSNENLKTTVIIPTPPPVNNSPVLITLGNANNYVIVSYGAVAIAASSIVYGNIITSGALSSGDSAILVGNAESVGAISLGANSNFTGIMVSRAAISLEINQITIGDIYTPAAVTLGAGSQVNGNILACSSVSIGASAYVTGIVLTGTSSEPMPGAHDVQILDYVIAGYNMILALTGVDLLTSIVGDILLPGTYTHEGAYAVSPDTTITLQGGISDTWIIKIIGAVAFSGSIVLSGGALASNIQWVATGAFALGAGCKFHGTVISSAAVSLGANGSLNGSAFSTIGAVSILSGASIIKP